MTSLWGSKKKSTEEQVNEQGGDNGDYGVDGSNSSAPSRNPGTRRDPDERTRLLGGQRVAPPRDGYLDPDDPAVS